MARGRKTYDKREAIKKQDAKRDMDRAIAAAVNPIRKFADRVVKNGCVDRIMRVARLHP